MTDQVAIAPEVMKAPAPERPEQLKTEIRSFFASPEAGKFFTSSPTHAMGIELKKVGKENAAWLTWASQMANYIANPQVSPESIDPLAVLRCISAINFLSTDTDFILKQQAFSLMQKLQPNVKINYDNKDYSPDEFGIVADSGTQHQWRPVDQFRTNMEKIQDLVKRGATARFVTPQEQTSEQSESFQDISAVTDSYFKGEYTKSIKNYKATHSKPEEVMKSLGLFFAEKVLGPDSNKPIVNLQRTAAKLVQYYSAFSEDDVKNPEMEQFLQTSVRRLHKEAVQAGATTNPEANIQTLCADIGLKFMESAYHDVKGKDLEVDEVKALKELKIDPTSLAFQDMYLSRDREINPLQSLREHIISKLSETEIQRPIAISAINKLFDPDVFRHMQSLLFSSEKATWQEWNTALHTINPSFREKIIPTALSFLRFPFKSKQNGLSFIFVLSMLLPQLLGSLLKTEEGRGQQA